jgi:hypothetical protein
VVAPLLSGDRSVGECLDVVLHVGKEVLKTTDGALKVEEEVGALLVSYLYRKFAYLLVRNLAKGVIGCLSVIAKCHRDLRSSCSLYSGIMRWNRGMSV